jgi:4a-hydroxytetrahydrobiopterin dehydratase
METKDFPAVIDLVGRIAEIAEAADHHPDMDIRYTKLRIALSTHDAGGVTVKDVEMAKKINALV